VIVCDLAAGERQILARRRARGTRQRRERWRVHLGWLAWYLLGVAVLMAILHRATAHAVEVGISTTAIVWTMGILVAWFHAVRKRAARLQQWPAMTITVSRHGLTIQDARTANRLEWADIGPILRHRHGLEIHDQYGNLLAYLPGRILTDEQRDQVLSLVQAAGLAVTDVTSA